MPVDHLVAMWHFFLTALLCQEASVQDIHPQYVVDENADRKAVMLSIDDWEKVVEALEELEDIRAYDKAKRGPQDTVAFEQAVSEIENGSNK
jgi:PHD/YefM family antitoxin component YafN of YafNO toxin-antitoxin module